MKAIKILLVFAALAILYGCNSEDVNPVNETGHLTYFEGSWRSIYEENGITVDLDMTEKNCKLLIVIFPQVGDIIQYTYDGPYRLFDEYDILRTENIFVVTDEFRFEIGSITDPVTWIKVECGEVTNKYGIEKL